MKKKHTRQVNAVSGTVIRGALSLVFYAFVITLVISAAKWGFGFGYEVFNGDALTEEKGEVIRYTIEEYASIRTIAADLEELGLIKDKNIMIVQKVFFGTNLLPGTYELDSSMTSKEMLDWMAMLSHAVEVPTEEAEEETTPAPSAEEETTGEENAGEGEGTA